MIQSLRFRFAARCSVALAAVAIAASAARAQVAPVPYLGGPLGLGSANETQFWGEAPDEDGFRKGFSFSSFSAPVTALGSGLAWSSLGAFGNSGGLTFDSSRYGYSFKGLGNTPVTLFGGVGALRANPDVFTSLVMPGFERSNTLATSVNAGVEFKPTSNTSLSLSANVVQPSEAIETDLRSQLLSGYRR